MTSYRVHVDSGLQILQQWYNPNEGLWDSTGWWHE